MTTTTTAAAMEEDEGKNTVFPNLGVSLDVFRRVLNDPRMKMPLHTLPLVTNGALTKPIVDLEGLDVATLKDMARAYRAFSDLDGDDEFGRYDGKIETSREELVKALTRSPFTAQHVCLCIVKPDTFRDGCSYAEILKKREARDNSLKSVALPTTFVSYAWRYSFRDLVETLEDCARGKSASEREKMFFWNDLFVEDQNSTLSKPKDYWYNAFKDAVGSIGHTILVLSPWYQPIALRRSWCIWEIYSTIATKGKLEIALTPRSRAAFQKKLATKNSSADIFSAMCKIDAESADAFMPEDRARIKETIERAVGLTEVNKRIQERLRIWLMKTGERALERMEAEDGEEAAASSELIGSLGMLLYEHGRYDKAEKLLRRSLKAREDGLGLEHPETLSSVKRLARVVKAQDNLIEATVLRRRVLKGREKIFGAENDETVRSMNDLASVLFTRGKTKEAETLFRRCLEITEKMHGLDSTKTFTYINNLAVLKSRQGDLDAAESYYRRALRGNELKFGPRDSKTIVCVHNVAKSLLNQGKFKEGEALLRRAFKISNEIYGPRHHVTIRISGVLASLGVRRASAASARRRTKLSREEKVEKAAEATRLLRRSLNDSDAALGPGHRTTLDTAAKLCRLLLRQGKKSEANEVKQKYKPWYLERKQKMKSKEETEDFDDPLTSS